jgi:hypothetical protein
MVILFWGIKKIAYKPPKDNLAIIQTPEPEV